MSPASGIKKRNRYGLAAGIGCFVTVFLLLFRPFGLDYTGWQDPIFWFLLGFAPFNAAMIIGLDLLLRHAAGRWQILSNRHLSLGITVGIIILGNAFYQIIPQEHVNWQEFPSVIWQVALIALFPTLFILLYYRSPNVAPVPDTIETLTFQDDSKREMLSLSLASLLYVTAERNYVLIYNTDTAQPMLLRTSLKTLAEHLANTPVVRCHRSYLVNTQQIVHRKKLARSMELSLKDTAHTIPVSASYISAIEEALAKN